MQDLTLYVISMLTVLFVHTTCFFKTRNLLRKGICDMIYWGRAEASMFFFFKHQTRTLPVEVSVISQHLATLSSQAFWLYCAPSLLYLFFFFSYLSCAVHFFHSTACPANWLNVVSMILCIRHADYFGKKQARPWWSKVQWDSNCPV